MSCGWETYHLGGVDKLPIILGVLMNPTNTITGQPHSELFSMRGRGCVSARCRNEKVTKTQAIQKNTVRSQTPDKWLTRVSI